MNRRDEKIERAERELVRKYDARTVARIVLPKALFFICGYFASLGELPFGARPFGIALLAAAGRETPFAYAGACVSAFLNLEIEEALVYFGVYTLLLFMRIFLVLTVKPERRENRKKFGGVFFGRLFLERMGFRIITSATVGLALGAAVLFSGGLLYYDLFGLLLLTDRKSVV